MESIGETMDTTGTASAGRLADFYIIGSAKAATNTLKRHLQRHPRLFFAHSEPSYYTVNRERGIDWYRSQFEEARADQLTGDCSTQYSDLPHRAVTAAESIARDTPDARIIYLMRHPVDRAYSHYLHLFEAWIAPGEPIRETFEEFNARNPHCVETSDYLAVVREYQRHFSDDKILLLVTEQLNADPGPSLRKVHEFLGLEPISEASEPDLRANTRTSRVDGFLHSKMIGGFTRRKPVRMIVDALPKSVRRVVRDAVHTGLKRSPYGRRIARSYTPTPMRPETRRALIERYAESNATLGAMAGADLSHWLH